MKTDMEVKNCPIFSRNVERAVSRVHLTAYF
jgi:hypothetical protein